jgi:transposase-like protein
VPRPPFPTSLREFQRQFANEEACQQYLAACRWLDGFACRRCGHQRAYSVARQRRWQCAACRHQASLTSGTILHNTKIPLTLWFWAAYLMTTDKRGISALLLQRQLGLRRYETAWMMLHKLRRAMVNVARELLHGEVVAIEKRGKISGRLRMAVIPNFKAITLRAFIQQNVAAGSTIYTDGLKTFTGLEQAGYKHKPHSQPLRIDLRKGAKSVVPLADRAIGNLQQWLIGTYHGVSCAQLQVYLDEFVFRHNRRKQPMAAFQTLLGMGSRQTPTPYRRIRGGRDLTKASNYA